MKASFRARKSSGLYARRRPGYLLYLSALKQGVEFLSKHSLRHHADHLIHDVTISEEQQGWSRTDTVSCGNTRIMVNVHFAHLDLSFKIRCQFFDHRGHDMARATPFGREDHQDWPRLLEHLGIEVLIC